MNNALALEYKLGKVEQSKLLLYVSHCLSAWGIRAFEFLVSLVLVQLYDDSLFMVALFGLLDSLVVALSSPYLGRYVDASERYTAATTMYFVQNLGTFVSSIGFWTLLYRKDMNHGVLSASFALLCILSACISSLGATGSSISVEREWTRAICGSDGEDKLARMNAVMKRIDLICLIGSPIVVGIILETQGYMVCLAATCLYNIAAWILECYTLKLAIECSDYLRQPVTNLSNAGTDKIEELGLKEQLHVYMKQSFFYFAISLAIIYMTVMSFGSTMTAFLVFSGAREATLSLFRGFGAICGVFATFVAPKLFLLLGLKNTAMYSIVGQTLVLLAAVASWIALRPTDLANLVLLAFLATSRFFLWLFDLSVNQIIQENAPTESIGTIFGVQTALQYTFQTTAYTLTLLWSDPSDFLGLMVISDVCIFTAMCLTIFGHWKS